MNRSELIDYLLVRTTLTEGLASSLQAELIKPDRTELLRAVFTFLETGGDTITAAIHPLLTGNDEILEDVLAFEPEDEGELGGWTDFLSEIPGIAAAIDVSIIEKVQATDGGDLCGICGLLAGMKTPKSLEALATCLETDPVGIYSGGLIESLRETGWDGIVATVNVWRSSGHQEGGQLEFLLTVPKMQPDLRAQLAELIDSLPREDLSSDQKARLRKVVFYCKRGEDL